jgi:hypothetical protein
MACYRDNFTSLLLLQILAECHFSCNIKWCSVLSWTTRKTRLYPFCFLGNERAFGIYASLGLVCGVRLAVNVFMSPVMVEISITPPSFLGRVRRPLIGQLYQPRMIDDDECGAVGGMRVGRGNRSTRRQPAPLPPCPPQIPHDLTWVRTRAAAVGNRRLTA